MMMFLYTINLEMATASLSACRDEIKKALRPKAAGLNAGSKRMSAPYGLEETVKGMLASRAVPSCARASTVQVNAWSVGGSGPPAFISWL